MKVEAKALAAILLLAGLTSLLWVRGIVPAVSRLDTDFPNYLTAARIVADGGPAGRLYDNAWFQGQMRRYGIGNPSEGKFAPFPPPTALLMLPLARLSPLDALRVMTAVSLLCLSVSILVLARILRWTRVQSAIFVLLSGYAVLNALRFGQPYIAVSLTCILGYYAHQRGRPLLAGVCFGLFVPIKYFPLIMLLYFLFRREWKLVLAGAAAATSVVLISIGVLGWQVHQQFLLSVLGTHLTGDLSMQDPFSASFQSFDSLFRRLFVFDATANPHPWLALPWLRGIAVAVTKMAILAAAVVSLVELARNEGSQSVPASIGLLGILVLLLAPATATYHFVLLWLPVGLLVGWQQHAQARARAALLLGLYSLIGFLPYGHLSGFEDRGGLSVLAYPRLLLLLAMFSACVYFIWSEPRSTRQAATQS